MPWISRGAKAWHIRLVKPSREGVAAVKRPLVGQYAGMLGTLAVLSLWIGVALPARLTPNIGVGVGLTLMTAGVLLTALAALLHSKLWLFALAAAVATFVLFAIAEGA
jgi:hypothetical protein